MDILWVALGGAAVGLGAWPIVSLSRREVRTARSVVAAMKVVNEQLRSRVSDFEEMARIRAARQSAAVKKGHQTRKARRVEAMSAEG